MTLKQEIRNLLKTNAPSIVKEQIMSRIIKITKKGTNKLLNKLTKIDVEDNKQIARAFDRIHTDLISQTIRQLLEYQYGNRDENGFKK